MKKSIGTVKETLARRFMDPQSPAVMLWGGPGIGKSQIIKQIADDRNMTLIDMRLAQIDPVELRGPLMRDEEGKVTWLTPSVFPDEDSDENGVIFLDELNLAPTSIQNTAYQLIFKGEIGEYELPRGWTVIAAGNKEKHAQVHTMQPPLKNRFYHVEVRASLDDWKAWAYDESTQKTWAPENKINPMILAFLSKNPNFLYKFDPERDTLNFPTPRSWELVSYLLDTGAPYSDLAGAIGENAASQFQGYLRVAEDMPDIDDILEGEDVFPDSPDVKYAVASGLIARVKEKPEYLGRLFEYAVRLGDADKESGTEFAVLIGRDALKAGLDPDEDPYPEEAKDKFVDYAERYRDSVKST